MSLIIVTLMTLFYLSGCASSKKTENPALKNAPEWFKHPSRYPNYIVVTGTNSNPSHEMMLAHAIAMSKVRNRIAEYVQTKMTKLEKKCGLNSETDQNKSDTAKSKTHIIHKTMKMFMSQQPHNSNYKITVKSNNNIEVNGITISNERMIKVGHRYLDFILAKYPIGAIDEDVVLNMKKKYMYKQLESKKPFQAIEKKAQKYKEKENEEQSNDGNSNNIRNKEINITSPQKHSQLIMKFDSTKAYKELVKDVKKYDKWKKTHPNEHVPSVDSNGTHTIYHTDPIFKNLQNEIKRYEETMKRKKKQLQSQDSVKKQM